MEGVREEVRREGRKERYNLDEVGDREGNRVRTKVCGPLQTWDDIEGVFPVMSFGLGPRGHSWFRPEPEVPH